VDQSAQVVNERADAHLPEFLTQKIFLFHVSVLYTIFYTCTADYSGQRPRSGLEITHCAHQASPAQRNERIQFDQHKQ